MKGKISKRAVDALIADARAADAALFLWDAELPGFGVKATPSACSYVVQYRLGGRGAPSKRLTLGKHGALTPDEARKRAKEELGKVANGKDVVQAKKDERAKLKAGTFRDLSESYFAVNGTVETQASGSPGNGKKPTSCWTSRSIRRSEPRCPMRSPRPSLRP